ncbi:MAG: uracil-DNA glycosylase [Candidatus Heimdallarchaeota archaeon]|nr:uracil-DNA glycosylase [Candidatus Heimdallarchaeota archaeon]
MSFKKLKEKIMNCHNCSLWKKSGAPVLGEGAKNAQAMIVGQNPGKTEEKEGRPFIGRSGKFLDKIFEKHSLNREELYITNVVKHKTPNNRKPTKKEIKACMPYLLEEINLVQPEIVVLLGNVAQEIPREEGITYIETYHPAAALRFPKWREKFEEAFKSFKELYND